MRARTTHRKTAPRVKGGRVQKKNRWALSPDRDHTLLGAEPIAFEARAPETRQRHVVNLIDVQRFLRCIPDAATHTAGLRAIVLGDGEAYELMGMYDDRGIITLCSWPDDLTEPCDVDFIREHASTLDRLGVPRDQPTGGQARVYFDEATARAFQLLHILLHELGHHRDVRARRYRGEEASAEAWAVEMEERVWPRYKEFFGVPGRRSSAIVTSS